MDTQVGWGLVDPRVVEVGWGLVNSRRRLMVMGIS